MLSFRPTEFFTLKSRNSARCQASGFARRNDEGNSVICTECRPSSVKDLVGFPLTAESSITPRCPGWVSPVMYEGIGVLPEENNFMFSSDARKFYHSSSGCFYFSLKFLRNRVNLEIGGLTNKTMNIFWISGKCGYGKTAFADSIIKGFEEKGKKTYKLNGKDFIGFLIKNIRMHNSTEEFASYFQNYDLLILDNLGYVLGGKKATQEKLKEVIKKIVDNRKTKVVLITQKRPRKVRKLKFDSDECFYRRLKAPSTELKRNLFKKWIKQENLVISKDKIEEIINKSDNLFQLKGLFNQISFLIK